MTLGRISCGRRRSAPSLGVFVVILGSLWVVEAEADAECSVSTTGVAFGTYDPTTATPNDSTGDLRVVCSHTTGVGNRVNYTVTLSPGSSGSYLQRLLNAGTSTLAYNLFDSATHARIWGDGTGGTGLVAGALTVGPGVGNRVREESHPIYGRIPAQQSPAIGQYTDTIVVTLIF